MSEQYEESHFGKYQTGRLLGRGAMASVYLATDAESGREVALKVLRIDPGLAAERRREMVMRFEAEARIAAGLSHPALVRVHEAGATDDALFIAMEAVVGDSLDDILKTGRILAFDEIVDLAAAVAAALDHAHSRGVIHRDIKPGNVLLGEDGTVKVVDFGVAHEAASTLTGTGIQIGTPAYMSPEQIRGGEITPAADQFALASLLYRMLTGKLAFRGERPTEVMYSIVHEEPERPSAFNLRLDRRVDDALLRGLSKEPADRHASCQALVGAVRRGLGLEPDDDAPSDGPVGFGATTTVAGASAEEIRRQIGAMAQADAASSAVPFWRSKPFIIVLATVGLALLLWAALT